jgi:hypothetical protein
MAALRIGCKAALAFVVLGSLTCHSVPDRPTLTVTSTQAVLDIPVPQESAWTWYRSETAGNSLEYRFDVAVDVADTLYAFGFYLYKDPRAKPVSGPLDRLLLIGQKSVWRGHRTVPNIWIRPELDVPGLLRLRLLDADVVAMIFGNRPDSAEIRTTTPDFGADSIAVPIRYAKH